jgi:hypothetical protein
MPDHIDPYFINRLNRTYETKPLDCLIVWKSTVDIETLNRQLKEKFEVVNQFLGGEIVHCRGDREELKSLLTHDDIEILHATFPPIIF